MDSAACGGRLRHLADQTPVIVLTSIEKWSFYREVQHSTKGHPGASPTEPRGARASGFLSFHLSSRSLHCLLRVVGFVCVCCMLRHRSYVASCVWRLCRAAHWLSRPMLRACCWLCAARCSSHTKCGGAVCFLWHLACARVLLHVVCCLLHVVRWTRCLLVAVFCAVSAVCRMLPCRLLPCCLLSVARCLLSFPRCLWSVACCILHAALRVACRCYSLRIARMHRACCLAVVCCMRRVVCCIFPVACSPSHVVWFAFSSGLLHVVSCVPSVARCPLDRACCTLSVVCCTLSVVCCLSPVARSPLSVVCFLLPARVSPCRMACAVCRLSHVASRHVACAALRVGCCIAHVPCLHVVSCPLRVPSCMPSIAGCTVDSQRRRARSASLRTHGYSQSNTITLATRTHARTHARTHTSVCSRSCRPLRRSTASAAAGIRAPEASRRIAETVAAACLRS